MLAVTVPTFQELPPEVRWIIAGAAGFVLLVLVLRVWGRRREAARYARARAEMRAGMDAVRMQHAELQRLATQVVATSSTGRIAGYVVVQQFETVFSDGQPSSAAAVEQIKALAAIKGSNALINLHSQQTPSGKWTASGDAVVVKALGRPGARRSPVTPQEASDPPPSSSDDSAKS